MLKVMIVDDMDIVRREIKRMKLWGEKTGFIISDEAKNGQEALEKLEKNPVDLVITDIKMPKIDGIELLRNVVKRNLCSCVVLLSDFSEFSYARQGLILGAFDYMAKPLDENELEKLLQRAKEVIVNTSRERERIKKLEETLGEKVEIFFPAADVIQLVELIQTGDMKAFSVAERIVDITGANLNQDLMKVESVLKNVVIEIVKSLKNTANWLENFVNLAEFKNMDFSMCEGFCSIKTVFTNSIRKIGSTMKSLQYGIDEKGVVQQVCNCVLANVDSELSLKIVAERLFMNKTYISETFKQKTGVSFVAYLTFVKMERAKILVTEEKLKFYEIAEKLGYRDVEYFSKLFKKHTGLSPTEFRQMYGRKY